MQPEELIKLATKVQHLQCEFQTIKVKAAHKGCPTRLFDTLSSFSNQDEGGIIIFGLNEETKFETVGVYDPQDLQKKITEQCKQMSPMVRALFTVAELGDKIIVSAEIPSVDITERPVFYQGVGRSKGSYIRVGDSDEPMSEYEIYSYDAFRKRIRDDIRIVPEAKATFFDAEKVANYLMNVKHKRKNLATNISDDEILELMGIMSNGIPTLAGELCFSRYPQGMFPQLCVTAVSIPGTEMGDIGNSGERFIDNERITGSIGEMVEAAVDFVRRNSRTMTIIDNNGKRIDREEYPPKAVREAIINALVHRDYSIHTENVPVRMEMYRDRLKIISSGGLYGKITIDALGKVRSETRNAALANILELMQITENRYSGIPTIRAELKEQGLPDPSFKVERGEFVVVFRNNLQEELKRDFQPITAGVANHALLDFCEIPRSRKELVEYTGYSQYYTMTTIVKPLLEAGLLKMTMPEKPGSKNQRFVKG